MKSAPMSESSIYHVLDKESCEKWIVASQYQDFVFGLTAENMESTMDKIIKSNCFTSKTALTFLFNQLHTAVCIRPTSRFLYVDLIKKICQHQSDSNFIEYFRSLFLTFELPLLQSISFVALLRECYLQNVFTMDEVVDACTKFYNDAKSRGYAGWVMLCWFAPEIQKLSPEFYADHIDRINVYYKNDVVPNSSQTFIEMFEFMRQNNWEKFTEISRIIYMPHSIPLIIINDDIDSFQQIAAQPNFDMNEYLPSSPWEYSKLIWSGLRLIQFAAFHGAVKIFNFLIQNGADKKCVDKSGHNIMYCTIAGGFTSIISKCDEIGIETDISSIEASVLYFRIDLFMWIKDKISLDLNQAHVLHMAAAANNIRLILLCIENGCDVNSFDDEGNTPLINATSNNSIEALSILLKHKNIDVALKDPQGQSALSIGAQMGRLELFNLMVEDGRFDLNEKDSLGMTPLHHAVDEQQVIILKELIKLKEIEINSQDANGDTPLHTATRNNFDVGTTLLMGRDDLNLNVINNEGDAPIHICARNFTPETELVMKALLSSEKTDKNIKDKDGRTPLHIASLAGNEELLKILLNNGASLFEEDSSNETPFHLAAANGIVQSVKFFIKYPGIDVNMLDSEKSTPLHLAALNGEDEIVSLLLDAPGINLNIKNGENLTPLEIAEEAEEIDIYQMIHNKLET
ncbi:hypothetical protein TRFO_02148 [Tritrichomonas foetus]|uniref:Uncharacterized protein n=1 Tax=Tritrichomonas foetus TaxID=1144522 RepID=A0A1J4J7T3_9EUKA|nr:hypothetical protein TRFO_02148 [Tritrichomonas foetus]|eukprot:OHS95208.1 hypothetical protein TRFO_02148 [Tritrichomonas foetus]